MSPSHLQASDWTQLTAPELSSKMAFAPHAMLFLVYHCNLRTSCRCWTAILRLTHDCKLRFSCLETSFNQFETMDLVLTSWSRSLPLYDVRCFFSLLLSLYRSFSSCLSLILFACFCSENGKERGKIVINKWRNAKKESNNIRSTRAQIQFVIVPKKIN